MRAALVTTAILATLAVPASANDGIDLSIKSKSMAAAAAPTTAPQAGEAPFRVARDPLPSILMHEEQERRTFQGSCESSGTALCYDLNDKHIVYRGARGFMPKIEGLRAESVSVRHDRIILKYSF